MSNRIATPSTQSGSRRLSNRDIMSSIMFSTPTISRFSSFRSFVAAVLESSPRRMPGGKFNDALINIGGYLTRCYITANQRRNEGLPTMHCVHYYSQLRFSTNVWRKVFEIHCDFGSVYLVFSKVCFYICII
jgi:hypothetical protein